MCPCTYELVLPTHNPISKPNRPVPFRFYCHFSTYNITIYYILVVFDSM